MLSKNRKLDRGIGNGNSRTASARQSGRLDVSRARTWAARIPFKRPTRRWVAGLLAVALVGIGLAATTAEAQTTYHATNIRSSDDNQRDLKGTNPLLAARFNTGSDRAGYKMREFTASVGKTRNIDDFFVTVKVYGATGGHLPDLAGGSLGTLYLDGDARQNRWNTWTANRTIYLHPDTDYFVVITCDNRSSTAHWARCSGSNEYIQFETTNNNRASSNNSSGWGINTGYVNRNSSGTWFQPSGQTFRVDVKANSSERPYVVDNGVSVVSVGQAFGAGRWYGQGDVIRFGVEFNEAVKVRDDPTFKFTIGDGGSERERVAAYARGSHTDTLEFEYVVQQPDTDSNGITVGDGEASMGHNSGGPINAVDNSNEAMFPQDALGELTNHRISGILVRPNITGVTVTSNPHTGDTYWLNESIEVTASFDKRVTVSGGAPELALWFGTGDDTVLRMATYDRGSGTPNLVFAYTVLPEDADSDGVFIAANALAENSAPEMSIRGPGTIVETGGNRANARFDSISRQAGPEHKVDGSRVATIAGVAITSQPLIGDTYSFAQPIEITVTFSEAMEVTGALQVALQLGADTKIASYVRGSGTDRLVFAYAVLSTDLNADGVSVGANTLADGGDTDQGVRGDGTILSVSRNTAPDLASDAVAADTDHMVNGTLTQWTDTTLDLLDVSGITLTPPFQSAAHTYVADVVKEVEVTTVTASATRPKTGIRITPEDSDDVALGHQVALDAGENVISVTVTAADGTTTQLNTVTVTKDANQLPTATEGSVTTDEDTPYGFAVADFNFVDADANDSLQGLRVVTLPNKGALTLNGDDVTAGDVMPVASLDGNLVFTPSADENGDTYTTFTYKVFDILDESVSAYPMTINVTSVEDAPRVALPLHDLTGTVDRMLDHVVPEDAFYDPDGDSLSYAAAKADDSALPTWLSFATATHTFSGTPAAGDAGTVTLKVTVSDGNGNSVSDEFDLVVGMNSAPTAMAGTATLAEDGEHEFMPGDFNFADADSGDSLASVRIVTLPASGSLMLNDTPVVAGAVIRTSSLDGNLIFAPEPDGNGNPYTNFAFKVSDGLAESNGSYFMSMVVTPVEDLPRLSAALTDQVAGFGQTFTYVVPAGAFTDPDGDPLYYAAALSGGNVLPSWLTFAPATRTFNGTPAAGDAGTLTLKVTVSDDNGASLSDEFELLVQSAPKVSLVLAPATIAERDDVHTVGVNEARTVVTATVPWVAGTAFTVDLSTLPVSPNTEDDYALSGNTTLSFAADALSSTGTVTIESLDNVVFGPDRLVTVSGSASVNVVMAPDDVTLTIEEDEEKPILAFAAESSSALESESSKTVRVVLNRPSLETIAVTYSTLDGTALAGTDYTALAGTLSFAPGTVEMPLAVEILDDDVALEADKNFYIRLSGTDAALVTLGEVSLATISIVDDDQVTVSIAEETTVSESAGVVEVTVSLSAVVAENATLNYITRDNTASAGTDFTARSGTVTILAGQQSQTISIPVLEDGIDEDNEFFEVVVSPPVALQEGLRLVVPKTVGNVFITDNDDEPVLSVADASAAEGLAVAFTVTLTPASGKTVTLDWAASAETGDTATAGDDFQRATGSRTFSAGQTTLTVNVATVRDTVDESAETFTLTLSNPSNATLDDATAVGTIESNSNTAPTSANGSVTMNEDEAYAFQESNFAFTDTDAGDRLASIRVVTLPGEGSLTADGSPVSAGDTVDDIELLVFTPVADANGANYASFTFKVSDGVLESASAYTMTLDVTPVADAPVVATALVDQTAAVDLAYSYVVPADAFTDIDGDTLIYSAARGDDSALPAWLTFTAATRTFTGTPGAADTGTVALKVTVKDSAESSARSVSDTFDLTVRTNAAPTSADKTVTLAEDATYAFAAADFAFTDSDSGDALTSVRIVTLPGLGSLALDGNAVSVNDAVPAADLGDLAFTPVAHGNGDAYTTFTFKVSDGLEDSNAAYTLTIDVTAVADAPVVDTELADQTATTGRAFSYVVPADAFTDADGDTLIYSAARSDDSVLPSWLTFTVATREFTGTPGAGDAGTVALKVTVKDSADASARSVSDTFDLVVRANSVPTSANKTVTLAEDGTHTFSAADFAFTDSDSGDELTSVRIATLPGLGSLALDGNAVSVNDAVPAADLGDLAFTPVAHGNGDAYTTFTFKVSDGVAESEAAYTMTVDVTAVADAPVVATELADQTATTGRAFSYVVPADAFTDADGDTLIYSAARSDDSVLPSWLTFTVATREFTGTPGAGDAGTVALKVTVKDSADASARSVSDTFDLVVRANSVPTSANKTVTLAEDGTHTFSAADFAFTDSDSGDELTSVRIATLPGLGSLALDGNAVSVNDAVPAADLGDLAFTPVADGNGDAYTTFTFMVSDGVAESEAAYTMTVDVTAVADAPVVATELADQTATTGRAFSYVVPADAFTDADGDTLIYSAARSDDSVLPSWLTFTAATRTFTGTPGAGDAGTVALKVTVKDSADASARSVSDTFDLVVGANSAPTSANKTVTLAEDATYAFAAADFAFTDSDSGDELTSVRIVTLPGLGSLALDGNAVSVNDAVPAADLGDLAFTPVADGNGDGYTTFTFKVSDGVSESNAAYTLTLDVTPVADAPVVATELADQTATTGRAFSYVVPADAFTDADGDTLIYSAARSDDSVLPSWLTFTAATRTFTGTPGAGDAGTVALKVTVKDSADASARSVSDTFDLVVGANSAPTSANKTVTLAEDATYAFAAADFAFTDSDTGDELTSVRIVTLPGLGSLALDGNAVSVNDAVPAADLGDLAFTPVADGNGDAYTEFTFMVSDGVSESNAAYTLTLDVTPVADAPVVATELADQTATTGRAFSYVVPADAFTDADGDTLIYSAARSDDSVLPSWLTFTAATRTFTGTPGAGDAGTVALKVTVKDSAESSARSVSDEFDLTVRTNAAPTSADKTVTLAEDATYAFAAADFAFTDSDSGDELTSVRIVTLPGLGSLALDGNAVSVNDAVPAADLGDLAFTPVADGNGDAYTTFTFKVSDGVSESNAAYTLTLDVTPVADAPVVATELADQTATTGRAFSYVVPADAFTDADGDTLIYSAARSDDSVLPSWLTFTAATRTFTGTPGAGDAGTVALKVTVKDSADASARSVSDTFDLVVGANSAPTSANKTVTLAEDATYAFAAADFAFTDSDSGDELTSVRIVTLPGLGSLALDGNAVSVNDAVPAADLGDLAFTPVADGNGDAYTTFTFKVSDGVAESNAAYTMTLDVTPVADAPVVATELMDQTATNGRGYTFVVPADAFTDADGDTLIYSAARSDDSVLPAWLTFTAATRTFTGTPGAGDAGTVALKVTVKDSAGVSALSVSDTFDLVVGAYAAPVIVTGGIAVTSSPASGDTYGTGEQIVFSATFDQAVEVTGTPEFEFSLRDDIDHESVEFATLTGGSGTTVLVFSYTVQVGDSDNDGIWIGDQNHAVTLRSGDAIRGTVGGLDAVIIHAAPGRLSNHKVDGQPVANIPPVITTTSPISVAENTTAVTTLTATDADEDTLAWSKNGGDDAALFDLTSAGVLTFASAPPTFENPADTGADNGYAVTVRVSDGTATAELALTVNVTDVDEPPGAPGAPTGLNASPDGRNRIDLSWVAPTDTGGSAITGYRIEVSSDAGTTWSDLVANTGRTDTSYEHTGLAFGSLRHYRVSAINAEGTGSPSNVANATTDARPVVSFSHRAVPFIAADGTILRIPKYEVTITFSAPVETAEPDYHGLYDHVTLTNGRFHSFGAVPSSENHNSRRYGVWRAEVVPNAPPGGGTVLMELAVPDGVMRDREGRLNRAATYTIEAVVPNTDSLEPTGVYRQQREYGVRHRPVHRQGRVQRAGDRFRAGRVVGLRRPGHGLGPEAGRRRLRGHHRSGPAERGDRHGDAQRKRRCCRGRGRESQCRVVADRYDHEVEPHGASGAIDGDVPGGAPRA